MNTYKFMRIAKGKCNLPGCTEKIEDYKEWKSDDERFYQFCCEKHKKRFEKLMNDIKRYRRDYAKLRFKLLRKYDENNKSKSKEL